jgi:hypothetical protein
MYIFPWEFILNDSIGYSAKQSLDQMWMIVDKLEFA